MEPSDEYRVEVNVHSVGNLGHKPRDPRTASKYNVFSRILLMWVDPLLCLGCRRPLEQNDMYLHPREADSEKLLKRFHRHWHKEMERTSRGGKPRLMLALLRSFWPKIVLQGILVFLQITGLVLQSILLGYLAEIFSACTEPEQCIGTSAYLYATGISVVAFSVALVNGHNFLVGYKNGMISRIILTGAIYKKILSLSQVAVGQLSIGHIVNLASNDVQRLDLGLIYIHMFWIVPLHLVVVTYLIYLEIGWYTFIVTGIVCLLVPLQFLLARLFNHLRLKSAKLTDSRVRIMHEVITGIRVIKMYAWENAFKKLVASLRRKESALILQAGFTRAVGLGFVFVFINIVTYVTFTAYTASGGELTAKKVFTVISLLFGIRLTCVIFFIPNILGVVEARVAAIRIQKLLMWDELNCHGRNKNASGSPFVAAKDMTVSWTNESSNLTLCNISFTLDQENHLLAVVGPVGSGKSTLLHSLMNELKTSRETLSINGKLSYASQDPWVYSATLRENITFGSEYNRERYDRVLKACALDKDIDILINGDLTLVGEKGVTLSGGQKARVNLARAVYHDADIYLLDDPLSAVDTGVGKHIFQRCIQELLGDKLVVLVTHQVHFAILANNLLVLKDGKVEAYGSYSSIVAAGYDNARLFGLTNEDKHNSKEPDGNSHIPSAPLGLLSPRERKRQSSHVLSPLAKAAITFSSESNICHKGSPVLSIRQPGRNKSLGVLTDANLSHLDSVSISTSSSFHSLYGLGENTEEYMSEPPEDSNQGTLSTVVYVKYFQAAGTLATIAIFIAFIIGEIGIVLSEWWLSNWASCEVLSGTSSSDNGSNVSNLCFLDTHDRIYIFTGITSITILIGFARAVGFVYLCVNASKVLHNKMFMAVLRSPVRFFDTNPIGRILNRFSKDTGFLDDLMPYIFCEVALYMFRCFAVFLTSLIANPWVVPAAVLLLFILLLVRWYFLKTSREVKRIEAIARSPIYSHLSTTLQGLPVIRVYGKQDEALNLFHKFQNQHTQSWYIYLVITRWLGMRTDLLSALFVTVFSFMSIALVSRISDLSVIGLGLTYAISLSGSLQQVVRQSAEVENVMVSGERVMTYGQLEAEAPLESNSDKKPPENWPDRGCISFNSVSFQYSPDLPPVLHDISFSIKPSEKIGIVGRTGAGKSSLISVLYRLAEFVGQVTIDGIDAQTIGLHDLRKKMSIIPQDPVLFSGTVRYNLDPFDEYADGDLWGVLEQVQLSELIQKIKGQLNGELLEGGGNFSVGQRQLMCLARALLRKNRILIMDEATANVDMNTDRIIQGIIRHAFHDCTVLTIAHRLNTVMDSDRIMVMKEGHIEEFATPIALLQNGHSQFSDMVKKTGEHNSQKLLEMALQVHKKRLL